MYRDTEKASDARRTERHGADSWQRQRRRQALEGKKFTRVRGQCIAPAFAGTHRAYPRRNGQAELTCSNTPERKRRRMTLSRPSQVTLRLVAIMLSDEISGPMFVTVNLPTTTLPPSTGQYCYPHTHTSHPYKPTRIIMLFISHSSKYFCATT